MVKTIIGYKSPMDLFSNTGDGILKGSIFKKVGYTVLYKTDRTLDTEKSRHLPMEIVESWEPVYENTFEVGDWVKNSFTNGRKTVGRISFIDDDGSLLVDLNEQLLVPFFKHELVFEWVSKEKDIKQFLLEQAVTKGLAFDTEIIPVRKIIVGDIWGSYSVEDDREVDRINNQPVKTISNSFTYNFKTDTLTCYGSGVAVIYEKGVWAKKVEKVRSVIVGSKNLKVELVNNQLYISKYKYTLLKADIESIKKNYSKNLTLDSLYSTGELPTYEVTVDHYIRFIRIGCLTDNNLFSLNDLELVLSLFK